MSDGSMTLRNHLREVIDPVGYPGSIQITIAKFYPSDPEENKHVQGHHVGSWTFKPRKITS